MEDKMYVNRKVQSKYPVAGFCDNANDNLAT